MRMLLSIGLTGVKRLTYMGDSSACCCSSHVDLSTSCLRVFKTWWLAFPQLSNPRESQDKGEISFILAYPSWGSTYHPFYHILFIRIESLSRIQIKGGWDLHSTFWKFSMNCAHCFIPLHCVTLGNLFKIPVLQFLRQQNRNISIYLIDLL